MHSALVWIRDIWLTCFTLFILISVVLSFIVITYLPHFLNSASNISYPSEVILTHTHTQTHISIYLSISINICLSIHLSGNDLVFTHPNPLHNTLIRHNVASGALDNFPGIYMISCKDCPKLYIRETYRAFGKNINEHNRG